MTKILTIVALAASCFAANAPKPEEPLPIPAGRQEQISRAMISLQQRQLAAHAAAAQAAAEEARYAALVESLRSEYHASGCELTIEKQWVCPAAAIAKTTKEGGK